MTTRKVNKLCIKKRNVVQGNILRMLSMCLLIKNQLYFYIIYYGEKSSQQ